MNYIIVDLEATCWEGCKTENMEMIEIGAVCLDGEMLQPYSEFQQFVKPAIRPELTDFCLELTHIKQRKVDFAPSFPEAFNNFIQWIGDTPFRLCSWGKFDYDLFNYELDRCNGKWPAGFLGYLNLKDLYAEAYSVKPNIGLRKAMQKLGMKFEGTLHRALVDAQNISRVAQTMLVIDKYKKE